MSIFTVNENLVDVFWELKLLSRPFNQLDELEKLKWNFKNLDVVIKLWSTAGLWKVYL